jgi:hypothetical protein
LALIAGWAYLRNKPSVARSLPLAIAVGALLTALRVGYAVARRVYLTTLYAQWLRTMDQGFEINVSFVVATFLTASSAAWLYLNARSHWARSGAFLAALFPASFMAAFWLGSVALINVLARREVGLPLYGYGGGLMPLIACAVEGAPIALSLWGARRIVRADDLRRNRG